MISFIDLQAQQKRIRSQLDRRIAAVLDHGNYIMGPEIAELEGLLANYVGVSHVISCADGTDALVMALMAEGVGPGDLVFVPAFTFFATAEVVSLVGATPVFVDIDPRTFMISGQTLRDALDFATAKHPDLRPRAVIPVDLFGQPYPVDEIEPLANQHGMFILEDAAQGFGGDYRGRKACSLGYYGTTSFFPAKPLGCYGDGGAIFTNDADAAARLRSIRVHGQGSTKYENVRIGLNGRLDTLQAAILIPKLEIFNEELDLRNSIASRYSSALKDCATVPYVAPECTSSWAQYSILVSDRDELITQLKSAGIPTMVYYPIPLHLQGAFAHLGYEAGDLPFSERAAKHIVSLPMYPYLEEQTQEFIISQVRKYARPLV